MLFWFTVLVAAQWAGQTVATLAGLPVPGPVIGMVLLLIFLFMRGQVPDGLSAAANPLLKHLSLLFIPAGVGVIAYPDLVKSQWPALVGSVVLGTLATLLLTGWLMLRLIRGRADDHGPS